MPEHAQNFWDVPNLLLQKLPAPSFTATAKLSFVPLAAGNETSLIVMGLDYAYLSLLQKEDGLHATLTSAKDADLGTRETRILDQRIDGSEFYLRVTVAENAMASFSLSTDGKRFAAFGEPFQARPGRWIGAKVGLFAVRPNDRVRAGYADYDWFRFEQVLITSTASTDASGALGPGVPDPPPTIVSSSFAKSRHRSMISARGLGPIGSSNSEPERGMIMHNALAFTSSGVPLGLLSQRIQARQEVPEEGHVENILRLQCTAIEEKESCKSLQALRETVERTPPGVKVVTVAEMESDFFEFLTHAAGLRARFLIRARTDRLLVPEESAGYQSILEALTSTTALGSLMVKIPGNGQRKARTADAEVKVAPVTIKPPQLRRHLLQGGRLAVSRADTGARQARSIASPRRAPARRGAGPAA